MPTFVALLRGINVGKAKRVPMEELRALLTKLGYSDVATLLNSGNAVFRGPAGSPASHASKIAAAISRTFGFDVHVVVKSTSELDAIVAECPIDAREDEYRRFLVAFAQDGKALSELQALGPLATPPDRFALGKNAAYLFCGRGLLESPAGAAILGKAGRSATTRNWATVLKLQVLARERR